MKDVTLFIPARRNSKGLPFKNRKLLEITLNKIPHALKNSVLVSTDDEWIIEKCKEKKINFLKRSEAASSDVASTKTVVLEANEFLEEKIIMLYLTYPEREWQDVERCFSFFKQTQAKSLLCKKELKTSPFLMMYEKGNKGQQIIEHNLYRRQDYPKCFEISHYISIFTKKELDKLNNNMYNEDTIFYSIQNPIDVDTKQDLEEYNEKNKNNS